MQEQFQVIQILTAILTIGLVIFLLRNYLKDKPNHYMLTPNFLTYAEIQFYRVLEQSISGTGLKIFSKVRIADIAVVNPYYHRKYKFFNQISQKHLDFLVCNAELKPIYAIELDDRSHLLQSRIKRDNFVNDVFKQIGLPLARIKVSKSYNPTELRRIILQELSKDKVIS